MMALVAATVLSAKAYKVVHILGIVMVFAALGGSTALALAGGTKEKTPASKLIAIFHGIALLLLLGSGFGALSALGMMSSGIPGWVWVKVVLWLALGGALAIAKRKPELAKLLWFAYPVVALIAAYLAIYQPF
jgi:hypothetical protein